MPSDIPTGTSANDSSDSHSVTRWIEGLKQGHADATQEIWDRYFRRLMAFVARKPQPRRKGVADEEDVAIIAFNSFLEAVQRKETGPLNDRNDLWQLLVVIARRKAIDQFRHETRKVRGENAVLGESALGSPNDSAGFCGIDQYSVQELDPDFRLLVRELMCELDNELGTVARLKLEGYTNAEIAEQINRSEPTVERRLRTIRTVWKEKLLP